MLTTQFQDWLSSKGINNTKKVLCAVSGGIDSMVLLHLFKKENYKISVAHVNYHLRGEESNLDQKLVESFCENHKIPIHVLNVNKLGKDNLQEWARKERFQFFDQIQKKGAYDFIALAHHDEDQLETILLSIFKGYQLQSIQAVRGNIIRPLLGIEKKLIDDYASANDITFRIDKSNLTNNYDRNFIRHEIIPTIGNRIPNFKTRILNFAERQRKERDLLLKLLSNYVEKHTINESNNIRSYFYQKIELSLIEKQNGQDILVNYLKLSYKFSEAQIIDLLKSKKPEAEISNKNFIAQKTQWHLYVGNINHEQITDLIKSTDLEYRKHNLKISSESFNGEFRKDTLTVDIEKLKFPLKLRKVKGSESFRAFGLKGATTEIGKFLKRIDKPSYFKLQEYILIDTQKRIIIPGLEIDYTLRTLNNTKTCLIVDFEDKTLY